MANQKDSFDFNKYKSKEKKEKPIKEKPIKERKEKNTSFDVDGGFSFKSLFKPSNKEGSVDFDNQGKNKKNMGIRIAIIGGAAALIVIAIVLLALILPIADNFGVAVVGIDITREPDKLVYNVGDEPNYDGIRVTVTRRNGEIFIVRADECEFSGFDSRYATPNQYITVKYQGFTDTFRIEIVANEKPDPVLKAIYLDPAPTKTEYKLGERLNTSGGIMVREYMDGSTVRINLRNSDVFGWSQIDGPGTYTLTVKYAENGVLVTTTYDITVTE